MRITAIILFLSLACYSKNKLASFKDLQKEVEITKSAILKNKKPENVTKELAKLKTLFDSVIEEYKAAYPQKGPKEELEILTFFYAIEPVLTIQESKITAELCEEKTHEVTLMDGKTTEGKASDYAQPALEILSAICPK